jgi:hypothetical protein
VALLSVVYLPLPGAKSSGISTEEIRSQTTASTDPVRAALGSPRDLERNILDVASPFATSVRVESLTGLATSEKDAFILRIIVGPDWEKAPDELKRKLASLWYDLFENWAGQSDVIVVVQNASGEKVADVGHSGVKIFK